MEGPLDRHYFVSIYFNDPDGTILEIATDGPGWTIDEAPESLGMEYRQPPPEMIVANRDEARIQAETWSEPVPEITLDMALRHGMHHITAIGSDIERPHAFFGDLLGMRRVKITSNFDDPNSAHWYWGAGDGRPGTLITYFERDPAKEQPSAYGCWANPSLCLIRSRRRNPIGMAAKIEQSWLPGIASDGSGLLQKYLYQLSRWTHCRINYSRPRLCRR